MEFRDSLIASAAEIVKDFVIEFADINHLSAHYAKLCALCEIIPAYARGFH
jgi:hypothetical protein